jgi:short-subunit dehydrogenase involved in D-alanine esterification of teichoic acids
MKITGNQILITGEATGLGFALTDAFLRAGNQLDSGALHNETY